MNARLLIALAALLAAPAGASSPPLSAAMPDGETDTIATRAMTDERMGVDVRIGEFGPYRFLVDTGSQNTVIGAGLARALALPQGPSVDISGVAGQVRVSATVLDELVLGQRSYFGLVTPLLDERAMGADGIVGVDGLQGQRVLIDFRRNIMAVTTRQGWHDDAGYEIVVTARRRSGQLIITQARIEGIPVSVVIDTGAGATVGNPALRSALGKCGRALVPTPLESVTGQTVMAEVATVRSLSLQGLTLGHALIAFTDAPAFRALGLADKPAILLGMRELRAFPRVVIDFAARRVLFDLPESDAPRGI